MSQCEFDHWYSYLNPIAVGECLGSKAGEQWDKFVAFLGQQLDKIKGWFLGVPADTPCLKDVTLWECFVWAVRARLLRLAADTERVAGAFLAAGGGVLAAYSGYHAASRGLGVWNASGVALGGGAAALGYWMYTTAQSHSVLPRPCRPTATVYEAVFQMPLDAACNSALLAASPAAASGDLLASVRAPCSSPGFNSSSVFALGCEPWVVTDTRRTFTVKLVYEAFAATCGTAVSAFGVVLLYDADAGTVSALNTLDGSGGVVAQPWALALPAPPPPASTCCLFAAQQTLSGLSLWFGTLPSAGQWPHVFVPALDHANAGDTAAWDTAAGVGGGALRVTFAPCAMTVRGDWITQANAYHDLIYGDFAAVAAAVNGGLSLGVPFRMPAPAGASRTYLYGAALAGAPTTAQIDARIRMGLPAWSDALYAGAAAAGAACGYTSVWGPNQPVVMYPWVTPTSTLAPASSGGMLAIAALAAPPSGVLPLPTLTSAGSATVTYTGPALIGSIYNALTSGDVLSAPLGADAWAAPGALWVPLPPPWSGAGSIDLVPYGSAFYPPWLPLPVVTMTVGAGPQNVGSWPRLSNGPPVVYDTSRIDGAAWAVQVWITWTPPAGGTLPTGAGGTISAPATAAFFDDNGPTAYRSAAGPGSPDPARGWPSTFTIGNAEFLPTLDRSAAAYWALQAGNPANAWINGVIENRGGNYLSFGTPASGLPFMTLQYGDGGQPLGATVPGGYPSIVFAQTPTSRSTGP